MKTDVRENYWWAYPIKALHTKIKGTVKYGLGQASHKDVGSYGASWKVAWSSWQTNSSAERLRAPEPSVGHPCPSQ